MRVTGEALLTTATNVSGVPSRAAYTVAMAGGPWDGANQALGAGHCSGVVWVATRLATASAGTGLDAMGVLWSGQPRTSPTNERSVQGPPVAV